MAGLSPTTPPSLGSAPVSMSSAPKGMVVPVTTDATYSFGPVLLGFVIIGILVAAALFLYMRNHHNEYDQGGGHKNIAVTNNSQIPYTVSLPNGRNFQLAPDQTAKVSVAQHDVLSANGYNYDGTPSSHNYTVSNPNIRQVHITPSGIRSNSTGAENVQFINQAHFPVMFIERSSKGGRRWASDIVPPTGITEGHFVGKRTTWEVAHPTAEDKPIAEVTVGGKAKRLVFNGHQLTAE